MRRAVQALGVARTKAALLVGLAIVTAGLPAIAAAASGHSAVPSVDFPPTLEGYGDAGLTSLGAILRNRVEKVPFNLWATLLFLGAIIHTFATHRFQHIAHVLEQRHEAKVNAGATQNRVSAAARFFHFLGEPEVVFGLWTLPLFVTITLFYDRSTSVAYLNDGVNFTEAVFVVVIMTIALAYSTLGLLFVAISVGGTLTNFAAPPVLMVADAWGWTTSHMLVHFGWKAMLGIVIATLAYYLYFRRELHTLSLGAPGREAKESARLPIPLWVTAGHLIFMFSTVVNAHNPKQLIFVLLFFLAFVEVTEDFQRNFTVRPAVLVGFFLAGLVIHGGLQQWWIAPVLGSLDELQLALGTTVLTAFNDNAAVTYLCTLVPTMTEGMKYAAVAGAVTGGGLTVIANAPNPAGQSILGKHFEDGISALGLLAGSLLPTVIVLACFIAFR